MTVRRRSDWVGSVLLSSALRICSADDPGWVAAYSAAAPVTCGVAIEVPLYWAYLAVWPLKSG